jgi:hypothetical protein
MKTLPLWVIGGVLTGALLAISPMAAIITAIAIMVTDSYLRSQ